VWRTGFVRVTGRRGRRGTQLVDDQNENKWYWKLEDGSTGSHCVEKWLSKSDAKTPKKRYAASRWPKWNEMLLETGRWKHSIALCGELAASTRKKRYAASRWPKWNEMILETGRRSTGSHCVKKWLCKRLRTCRKSGCGMTEQSRLYRLCLCYGPFIVVCK
jgi:hypothetical protein